LNPYIKSIKYLAKIGLDLLKNTPLNIINCKSDKNHKHLILNMDTKFTWQHLISIFNFYIIQSSVIKPSNLKGIEKMVGVVLKRGSSETQYSNTIIVQWYNNSNNNNTYTAIPGVWLSAVINWIPTRQMFRP